MTHTNTITTPPPASPQPKRKGLIRRHPIISSFVGMFFAIVAAIITAAVVLSAAASSAFNASQVHAAPPSHSTPAKPATSQPAVPAPPPGPATLAVGEQLPVTQNGQPAGYVTVKSVQVTTAPADSEFGSAPQNGYFLIVGIKAHSTISGFDINSLDFYAKVHGQHYEDGNGNSYDAISGTEQDITSTLNAGETATGQVLFDVSGPHGKIVYAPNYDSTPLAAWKF
jgi:hypothetical protein